jgi:hypothetical protein
MPFHVQPLILISVANGFAKNAAGASRRKLEKQRPERSGERGKAGMNIRDYSLIQRPSQIKRASRHVPLINILDQ